MSAVPMARKTSRSIQSVSRALSILKAFDGAGPQLGIAEISRRIHLSPSTVYRLVVTLERAGFLEQDQATEKYQLGLDLFRLGCTVVRRKTLDQQSQSWMERLADQLGEDVGLGVLHQSRVVFVRRVEGTQVVKAHIRLGATTTIHSSSLGKAILAWRDEAKADAIIKELDLVERTPYTITSASALKDHLRLVRERGYAMDDEESVIGVRCVGAPILDHLGVAIAALSISGPANRLTHEKIATMAGLLMEAANGISRDLGYFSEAFKSEPLKEKATIEDRIHGN